MRAIARQWVTLFVTATSLLAAGQSPDDSQKLPSAESIIQRALKRVEQLEERGFEKRLRFDHLNVLERLDSEGAPKSREERRYKVYPLQGHQYYELVEKDGRPLEGKELRKEQKRRQEFLDQISKSDAGGKGGDGDKKDDPAQIRFNEELIARYRSEVVGREVIKGRPAFVLRFEPKAEKLPVRRRLDYALNNSRGKLWIDEQDFIPSRLEFTLIKPVRFWGGLLGALTKLDGRLDLVRLENGAWLYQQLDVYMDGRILFTSLHQKVRLDWSNFRAVSAEAAAEDAAGGAGGLDTRGAVAVTPTASPRNGPSQLVLHRHGAD